MRARLVDGLDVDAELQVLARLETFNDTHVRVADNVPQLQVVRYNRRVRKSGHARAGRLIKLNIGTQEDRFDVRETLVHELTHIYWQRRLPTEAVGHDSRFWAKMDRAFREAYGDLRVAPRVHRYHGRYADALRREAQAETTDTLVETIDRELARTQRLLDQQDLDPGYMNPTYYTNPNRQRELTPQERAFLAGTLGDQPYDRPAVIGNDHLPQPLTGMTEPKGPVTEWFPRDVIFGVARQRSRDAARSASVIDTSPATVEDRDERVRRIVWEFDGLTRQDIDAEYASRHGEYPGSSTYNSLWRLRRDGKVYRTGRGWHATREAD